MQRNYRFDPDPHNTHAFLLAEIPEGARVLEVGTASGYLGEYLINHKKCEVWGVEPVKELYDDALNYGYTKLYNMSGEEFLSLTDFSEKFDCILLGDVLEHMVDPTAVLAKLKKFLRQGGKFVVSLPNIAHYSTRFHLFSGKWDMKDGGILDRTHLRFFTKKTMVEMFEKSGLKIVKMKPSSGSLERFGKNKLFGIGKKMLYAWETFFAIQFIIVATLP
jgi:2-polyprenyl-3-methyl-5-hydroxy-6-metoxy-1,4-benzoquinol methylase